MISNKTAPRSPAKLMSKNGDTCHSDLAVPPGEYLEEVISEIGVNKTELAAELGLSAVEMAALLVGKMPLTQVVAARLEKTTSVPANIWLGLESEYRLTLTGEAKDERQDDGVGESASL